MWKSIGTAAAVALAVAACVLLPMHGHQASAELGLGSLYVNAVDIDVAPGEIDKYLAALEENAAASVKQEPGCHAFNITVSQKDPNHVFIFEVYDNAAALEAHRATDHFKKYAATTKDMVAKREARALSTVAMYMKGT
jgi:(4S)-4-hydroxy-5-phosphonooxypentane-2,3-dione isomerase